MGLRERLKKGASPAEAPLEDKGRLNIASLHQNDQIVLYLTQPGKPWVGTLPHFRREIKAVIDDAQDGRVIIFSDSYFREYDEEKKRLALASGLKVQIPDSEIRHGNSFKLRLGEDTGTIGKLVVSQVRVNGRFFFPGELDKWIDPTQEL